MGAQSLVNEDMVRTFERDGYAILDRAIPDDVLQMLREECAYFVGYTDAYLSARNQEVMGITHKGKRYFIANRYRQSARIADFLFSDLMREVTTALLGDEVYLFHEQWVVKGPEQGMKFAWHQDSGYVKFRDPGTRHAPYLTCWCALDDMSAGNGTISVMPHARGGTKGVVLDHVREEGTNDLIGYSGDDPGELIEVAAGSIAVFSSTSLHQSSANTTTQTRRAYLAQYSKAPLLASNGDLWSQAVPFVKNGEYVYDRATDTAERWTAKRA